MLRLTLGLHQSGAGLSDNLLKAFCIMNSDLGEHLTIDLDTSLDHAFHETAVGHTFSTDRQIDTGDPKTTKIAFAKLAVLSCQPLGAVDGLGGLTEEFTAGTAETLR